VNAAGDPLDSSGEMQSSLRREHQLAIKNHAPDDLGPLGEGSLGQRGDGAQRDTFFANRSSHVVRTDVLDGVSAVETHVSHASNLSGVRGQQHLGTVVSGPLNRYFPDVRSERIHKGYQQ